MKRFQNALIGTKLTICFGAVLAFCVGGFVLCIRNMQSMDAATDAIANHWLPSSLNASQAKQQIIDHHRCVLLHLVTSDQAELATISERVENCRREIDSELAKMDDENASVQEREFDKKVQEAIHQYFLSTDPLLENSRNGLKEQAKAIATNEAEKTYDQALTLLEAEVQLNKNGSELAVANASRLFNSARWVAISAISSCILICWLAHSLLVRTIVNPLKIVIRQAQQIASGDLSVDIQVSTTECVGMVAGSFKSIVDTLNTTLSELQLLVEAAQTGNLTLRSKATQLPGSFAEVVQGMNSTLDAVNAPFQEILTVLGQVAQRDLRVRMKGTYAGSYELVKRSLNTAIDNLNESLSLVAVGAEQVNDASGQIANGSQSLAQGASNQASALAEISTSMEVMSTSTKQNAENAAIGRALAQQSQASVKHGSEAMARMGASIAKIKESADATAKIVKTIDDIAFQTNLLALNAAVEAARAGDAGKGFAVVAEEVRNLAQRSAEAAKTTADLIEESVKNSEGGVRINTEMSEVLLQIHDGARKVNDIICEIASATKEQASGIEQVNNALTNLDKLTQETAANSEESASAGEQLNAQASSLANTVAEFKLVSIVANPPVPNRTPVHHTKPQPSKSVAKAPSKSASTSSLRPADRRAVDVDPNPSASKPDRSNRPKVLVPLDDDDFRGF